MKSIIRVLMIMAVVLRIPFAFGEIQASKNTGETKPSLAEVKSFPLKEISSFDLKDFDGFKRGQYAECSDKPDPGVKAFSGFKSEKPIYGTFKFGGIYGEKDSGLSYDFAIDETSGTAKGYDCLYFDLNRDLDLSNDLPLKTMTSPPDGVGFGYDYIEKEIFFQYMVIGFDLGSGKKLEREFLPHLVIQKNGYNTMYLSLDGGARISLG